MILQPPFPNQEVRWEWKTKHWVPATPRQSGCPWQRQGGLCQFWATSVLGLLWAQKNVRGRFWNPSLTARWMAVHWTHSPACTPVPSNISALHTVKQKNCDKSRFASLSLESLHHWKECRWQHHPITPLHQPFGFWLYSFDHYFVIEV